MVMVGFVMLAVPLGAFGSNTGAATGTGYIKVNSNPAVPTLISVDGTVMNGGSIKKVPIATGNHTVSFSDVPGYATPDEVSLFVVEGSTSTVNANFELLGLLRVMSQPAVKTTISVDGTPSNDYGLWTYIEPGTHTVSFGPVAGYSTPANQTVSVRAGGQVEVTGVFVVDVNSTESLSGGMLRVITDPAVPSTISVDGKARDAFGLNWLTIEPGVHVISFSDVPGFATPAPQNVTVTDGQVTQVTGTFVAQGGLRIETTPPDSALIYINGIPRDTWGVWLTLPEGWYTVSFGAVPGHPTLQPQTVYVVPSQIALVLGMYKA